MPFDLLIRGGRVVDGSGLPGYVADVGVQDGRITEIGRLSGTARRTIEATGLVVAPGFIDHHTHLDAQLFWDPYGTAEPQNGVTSVVMGNCALSLAPVEESTQEAVLKSFIRVEAMPRAALEAGVPWGWRSYGEYLDSLEGRLGINAGGLVGHIAIRHRVMGEDAVEREANESEVAQMQRLLRDALGEGALGFSINRNARHSREDGKPVASRVASDAELEALVDVLGEGGRGVLQISASGSRAKELAWYDQLARRAGRPVMWQSVLHKWTEPDLWREQLDTIARTFAGGYRAYGLTQAKPLGQRFSLKNAQLFDEFPTWKSVLFLPEAVRKQAFAEPATRMKLKAEIDEPDHVTNFHRRWDSVEVVHVARPEHADYLGKTVAAVAAQRNQHPIDALIDVSLDEELETLFFTANNGGDAEAVGQILASPYVLVGSSDAGAHVQFDAAHGYSTTLLGLWVRDRGVMSLEQAVHKLTFQVASVYGLEGRGLVRPGYAADLAIFDPATVAALDPVWTEDFPAATKRLQQPARGVHWTVVNGEPIVEDGSVTGALPGQVLRSGVSRSA
ncbi:MAG: amidohydrolase family protein [Chloroflexi bacterium]|nr:amidohydrolase family protein [Chloroflexota bacterium]